LDGAEMLACGLATHFVPSNVCSPVTQILIELSNFIPLMMFVIIFMVIIVENVLCIKILALLL
jgi:hypothetical protein